jgi:hypothetical protein
MEGPCLPDRLWEGILIGIVTVLFLAMMYVRLCHGNRAKFMVIYEQPPFTVEDDATSAAPGPTASIPGQ